MNKLLMCVYIMISVSFCFAVPFDRHATDYTISLNGQWKFSLTEKTDTQLLDDFFKTDFDDSQWDNIDVPSNWEMQGFEEPHYYRPDPLFYGLYRKVISLPQEWKGRQVILDLEAVSFGYVLFVNGTKCGSFQQAFLPCQFDITPYVDYDQKNTIALKVYRDHDERHFDCNDAWALSGIFRDVYLFSPQRYHVDSVSINTVLDTEYQAALIEGQVEIRIFRHDVESEFQDQRELFKPMAIKLELKDASGNTIVDRTDSVTWITPRVVPSHTFQIPVTNAHYWNAEQPYLYDLSMTLLVDSQVCHVVTQKVGLRQVTIEDGILKVNGQRIKLRGVCRHELFPEVGRALREEHWLHDIKLMKAANINTVRCSHYPPHPRFLELCDKYGLYVLDEVPIGFGHDIQNDPVLLGAMLSRAQRTVDRDRNHPSVIIWDIGNENPLYGLQETAAKLVKMLDPTRPLLYPGENFLGIEEDYASGTAEFIDILAPHYPHNEEIERDMNDPRIHKPIIFTEINHALDLAFSDFETKCDMIEKTDKIAGCMIWLWADQGLMRKVNGREVVDSYADISKVRGLHTILSGDVWLDDNTILDSHGPDGTDGIIYADRRLQTDYYEVKKLYSPVHILQEHIALDSDGKISLTIENRYDFTNLNRLKANWKLLVNTKVIKNGKLSLQCPPHGFQTIAIEAGDLKTASDYIMLRVEFVDDHDNLIYERTLTDEISHFDWYNLINDKDTATHDSKWCTVDSDGVLTIRNSKGNDLLRGPFARIGRKPTMAERKTYPRLEMTIWEPPVLPDFDLISRSQSKQDDDLVVNTQLIYLNHKNPEQTIHADIEYTIAQAGWVDIEYTITPDSNDGAFLELGLAWQLADPQKIVWVGDGPFPSYPFKSTLDERGIYSITTQDPFFNGNRMNVEYADVIYSDSKLGIITNDSNIGWERDAEGNKVMLYQNLELASLGTKFKLPRQVVSAKDIGTVKGNLRLYLLKDNKTELIPFNGE